MMTDTISNLYASYEGLRKYPRISIDTHASFKLSSDLILEVVVHNISQDGVQIRCDRETAKSIHPSGKYIKGGNGPVGTLSFQLPMETGDRHIIAECQVYYLTVIQETGEIAFGCGFKKLITGQAGFIDQFIVEAIRPV